jgi:hypothetical protein
MKGIRAVQAERDSNNAAGKDVPPVSPYQLLELRGMEFHEIVDKHRKQLEASWTEGDIECIEREYNDLRNAYRYEKALQIAPDDCFGMTGFEEGWKVVEGRFNTLPDFCGRLATVFANTASVESDFSVPGWEKDAHRHKLTDLVDDRMKGHNGWVNKYLNRRIK